MRLGSDQLSEYLRVAAMEQTIKQLEEEGHTVEREARVGSAKADLRAVDANGKEKLYYFLVPGRDGSARSASRVSAEARARGAAYHVVLVAPPRDVNVEVVGIERWLEDAFRSQPPENIRRLAPRFGVTEVADVEVDRARVEPGRTELEGRGLVAVDTPPGVVDLEAPEVGDFPFRFRVVLDPSGGHRVEELTVDLPA